MEQSKLLSTEQKIEILEWLAAKLVIQDIDPWEHDALMHFPTFYVQFCDVNELDDPCRALFNAMRTDKQFPKTNEVKE
jgi:hypothetical protein